MLLLTRLYLSPLLHCIFAWWVPFTLKRRDRIITNVNTQYLKRSQTFGIKVPKTVPEALQFDVENGNDYWAAAIAVEMKEVKAAFKILDNLENIPPDHQFIQCHMIFDVKMEDFRQKARLIAGGHMTDLSAATSYASVVSRESVHIALTLATLNQERILECTDHR
jgi:hypothetical protein